MGDETEHVNTEEDNGVDESPPQRKVYPKRKRRQRQYSITVDLENQGTM